MGDRVLKAIGDTALESFRKTDFSCRYGGEEFCAILTNTGSEGAIVVAEKYRQMVESMRVDALEVTITIGVATYSQRGVESQVMDGDTLMKRADAALYQGKRSGRNRVVQWQESTPSPS